MIDLFGKLSRSTQIIVGFTLVAAVAVLDYITGVQLSFSIFYFLPIVIISWFTTPRLGILFSFLCALSWAYADFIGRGTYSSEFVFLFNTLVRLGIFLIVANLISRLKKNAELLTRKQLLTQHSYDVITTSQSLIVLLAKSITSYNTNLLIWIAKQKQERLPVPDIIESTSRKIGANMSTLTEICYSYQPQENEPLNLETLVRQLEAQMREVNQVADMEAQPPGVSGHSVGHTPELGHLFEFAQKHRL